MIRQTKTGYVVVDQAGKPLSKPDLTMEEARTRLKEVERFRAMDKWVKSKGG
jgi:hypothetical protein